MSFRFIILAVKLYTYEGGHMNMNTTSFFQVSTLILWVSQILHYTCLQSCNKISSFQFQILKLLHHATIKIKSSLSNKDRFLSLSSSRNTIQTCERKGTKKLIGLICIATTKAYTFILWLWRQNVASKKQDSNKGTMLLFIESKIQWNHTETRIIKCLLLYIS